MNENQAVIAKVRKWWMESRRRSAVARVRLKADLERSAAEVELILDDVRAEGIDPHSAMGRTIVDSVIQARNLARDARPKSDLDFPNDW